MSNILTHTRGGLKFKNNYKEEIKKCILNEISKRNEYLDNEYEKIENANIEINKIKTEYIAIKLLVNKNFQLINPDKEINHTFNFIQITEELEQVIGKISIEIDYSYKHLFTKEKNKEKIFDFEGIKKIAILIISFYKLLKLLNKFKRKDKNDFQPLKSYINSLDNIINNTSSESLKDEAKKEISFFIDIQNIQKLFNKNDELYQILEQYNSSLTNIGNQRSTFYGFKPIQKLNKNTCSKLEKFIKTELRKFIPKY